MSKLGHAWHTGSALVRARWYFRNAERLGGRVRVFGDPKVVNNGTLRIGDNVRLCSEPVRTELGIDTGATMEIGSHTFINYGSSIGATLRVVIGSHCNIGSHVIIMDNDFHRLEPERRNERPESAPVILEDNVWLGVRAVVLRGVTIGAGSVIAAGSVVVKDVPPRCLAGGVPAKVIREL